MNEILLISYFFPPRGGVGVQRVVKFCRYLPEFGIKPIVLTPKKPDGSFFVDEELASELPADIEVRRSFSFEPYHIYRALGGKRRQDEADFRRGLDTSGKGQGFLQRMYSAFQAAFLIPDPKIGWHPWAVADGKKVIRERNIKAILSTSPEATDHVIGHTLSRKFNIPHIMDFRDPWTMSFYCPDRPAFAKRRDEALELRCLLDASRIVSVQQKYIDDFLEKYPRLRKVAGKFKIVRNGFDPSDFEGVEPIRVDGFNIVYTGSISYPRDPGPFFKAFAAARENSVEFAKDAICTFVGEFDTRTRELTIKLGLDGVVEFLPYADHRSALGHQTGADALLLVSEGYVTAKAYEYLGAHRPVICLTEGEELRQLIEETGRGECFGPNDRDAMKDYLLKLHGQGKQTHSPPEDIGQKLKPYTRREQAKQLAELIEDTISG